MADEEKKEEIKEEVKEEKVEEKVEEKPEEKKEEPKEEKKEEPKKEEKKPEPSGKFKNIIKDIESLSVLELADLVKELEDRFGVSAAAPVAAVAGVPAAGAPAEEEKAAYTVHLLDAGAQKIAVIKAVRVIRQDLGLKEAKDLVDGAPKDVKADMPKKDAEEAKKNLEAAGAKVELK